VREGFTSRRPDSEEAIVTGVSGKSSVVLCVAQAKEPYLTAEAVSTFFLSSCPEGTGHKVKTPDDT